MHSLRYVIPSQPQTTSMSSSQVVGAKLHVPGLEQSSNTQYPSPVHSASLSHSQPARSSAMLTARALALHSFKYVSSSHPQTGRVRSSQSSRMKLQLPGSSHVPSEAQKSPSPQEASPSQGHPATNATRSPSCRTVHRLRYVSPSQAQDSLISSSHSVGRSEHMPTPPSQSPPAQNSVAAQSLLSEHSLVKDRPSGQPKHAKAPSKHKKAGFIMAWIVARIKRRRRP